MSDGENNQLTFIMERTGPGRGEENFRLWACRGEGRGCQRNKHRANAKHCDDCLPADNPNETLAEFQARLQRGDA